MSAGSFPYTFSYEIQVSKIKKNCARRFSSNSSLPLKFHSKQKVKYTSRLSTIVSQTTNVFPSHSGIALKDMEMLLKSKLSWMFIMIFCK